MWFWFVNSGLNTVLVIIKISICDCKSEAKMETEMENNFFFKKKVRAL